MVGAQRPNRPARLPDFDATGEVTEVVVRNVRPLLPGELTGPMLKAARILLGISVEHVAESSMLGVATLRRAEAMLGQTKLTTANVARIVTTYQKFGITMGFDEKGNLCIVSDGVMRRLVNDDAEVSARSAKRQQEQRDRRASKKRLGGGG